MSQIDRLSSQSGERNAGLNKKIVLECIQNPEKLEDISAGLNSTDARLAGDCAEVFSLAAMDRPDLAAPYAEAICGVRGHKTTRVRWEAAHCLALISPLRPELLTAMIPELMDTIRFDESIIVRDYSIDILANLSSTSAESARAAFDGLVESLRLWNGRHAGHALPGLAHAAQFLPERKAEILAKIEPFLSSDKEVIRKAARKAAKACA
jgi:hypothetical protein